MSGKVKVGWEVKKLGEVLVKTESIDPTKNPNEDFTYLDVSSVNKDTKEIENATILLGKNAPSRARKLVRTNDVIFATVRPTHSRVALITAEYDEQVCSTGYFVLRGKDFIYNQYLFYFLLTDEFNGQMEKLQKGASYPAVTDAEVKNTFLRYPKSLPEQQRIVAILDEAFAAIAQEKANAEQNLKNAKELFESYLQSVFENKGEGWVDKRLSDLCDIKHGFAFKSEYFSSEGNYVLLTPGNFYESGGYRDRGEKQKYYVGEFPNDYKLNEGDLLVAMTEQAAGLLGSPILVPKSGRFLHNQRLGLITKKANAHWINEFLFYVFNDKRVRKDIHNSATGIKVRHTSPTKIGDVLISLPVSITEQKDLVSKLVILYEKTKQLAAIYQQKINDLDELKKSILQKAFAGELC